MSELLECFDLKELGKQIVMKDTLKNILKKLKRRQKWLLTIKKGNTLQVLSINDLENCTLVQLSKIGS